MKKITILLFSLLLFSCNNNKIELTQEQYKQLTGDTIKPEYPKIIYGKHYTDKPKDLEIILIKNHEYLQGYGRDNSGSYFIIHYPDCKYCKKDTI